MEPTFRWLTKAEFGRIYDILVNITILNCGMEIFPQTIAICGAFVRVTAKRTDAVMKTNIRQMKGNEDSAWDPLEMEFFFISAFCH